MKISSNTWLLFTLIALVASACIGGFIFVSQFLQTGAPLNVNTNPTLLPTTVALTVLNTPTLVAENTATSIPPVGTCGQTGKNQVLIVVFASAGEEPVGSEAIYLIQANYANPQIKGLAFDRELTVQTPSQSGYPSSTAKLNDLYNFRLNQFGGVSQPQAHPGAVNLISQAIFDNYGLVPNNYIAFDALMLPNIVNAIGGLDVNLPAAYRYGAFSVPAGVQKWNGATTLAYVSALADNETEVQRRERQILVLNALLLNPTFIGRLPELTDRIKNSIITDLDATQITNLACLASQLGSFDAPITSVNGDNGVRKPDGSISFFLASDLKAYLLEWQGQLP